MCVLWDSVSRHLSSKYEQVLIGCILCDVRTYFIYTASTKKKNFILSQDRHGTVSNTKARSSTHCWRWKAISITHTQCVCVCVCSLGYPVCKANVPYYTATCSLSSSSAFFHITSLPARISRDREKRVPKIQVTEFSSEIFLILRRILRDKLDWSVSTV